MDLSKPYFPNLLLVSGNGRNSGKTTLIERIISHFKDEHSITGIKISPHFHESQTNARGAGLSYLIHRENDLSGHKDSSRMLVAGAKEVYYIQSEENGIADAFAILLKDLDKNHLWICESGGLRKYIRPGLFLLVNRKDNLSWKDSAKDLLQYSDNTIIFDGHNFSLSLSNIMVFENSWKLLGF